MAQVTTAFFSGTIASGGGPQNISVTGVAAGDRLCVFATQVPTSMSFDGSSLTKVETATESFIECTYWYLDAPTTGTHNLVVTPASNHYVFIYVVKGAASNASAVTEYNSGFWGSGTTLAVTTPTDGVALGVWHLYISSGAGPSCTAVSPATLDDQLSSTGSRGCAVSRAASGSIALGVDNGGSGGLAAGISVSFGPSGGGDVTAPVLTSPTGAQNGSTAGTGGATTDEANGTMYVVASTSATPPTAAQIKAGQMHTGASAAAAANVAVSSTGAKSLNLTGLTPSTTYYSHSMHEDAAANQSNVVTSSSWATTAAAAAAPPRRGFNFQILNH